MKTGSFTRENGIMVIKRGVAIISGQMDINMRENGRRIPLLGKV